MREKYANLLKSKFDGKKTDQGDAYILSRINDDESKAFIEVTPIDVKVKPLLVKERKLVDELLGLRQEIVEKAVRKIPFFREVAGKTQTRRR